MAPIQVVHACSSKHYHWLDRWTVGPWVGPWFRSTVLTGQKDPSGVEDRTPMENPNEEDEAFLKGDQKVSFEKEKVNPGPQTPIQLVCDNGGVVGY